MREEVAGPERLADGVGSTVRWRSSSAVLLPRGAARFVVANNSGSLDADSALYRT
jgi:hypothetical protein